MQIDFQGIGDDVYIRDVNRDVEIGSKPKWLSTLDAFITKIGNRSFEITGSKPMNRNVTIIDKEHKPVVSLVFFTKVLVINGRYEINDKGLITYNCNTENNIELPSVCKIKVQNNGPVFKTRIHWWDQKHVVEVHELFLSTQ